MEEEKYTILIKDWVEKRSGLTYLGAKRIANKLANEGFEVKIEGPELTMYVGKKITGRFS
jgi:hypothetical protein